METCNTDPGNDALQCTLEDGETKRTRPFSTEAYKYICFPVEQWGEWLKGCK
jgi:hypothetical protein